MTDGNYASEDTMMGRNFEEYRHLWEATDQGWVLLRSPDLAGGFCVFNKLHNTVLCVEDDRTNEFVCLKMKAAGCEILDGLPPLTPNAVVATGGKT